MTTKHTPPHIDDLRNHLMQTLAALRDRDNPMEPDRARAVAQVATVLVDTARVEVEYIKAIGGEHSNFLHQEPPPSITHTPPATLPQAHAPFPGADLVATTGRTVHRLQG